MAVLGEEFWGEGGGGHVGVEGEQGAEYAVVAEAEEVLVYAAGGEGEEPVLGEVVELGLEVADLDDDQVGAGRVEAEQGEVGDVVVRLAS